MASTSCLSSASWSTRSRPCWPCLQPRRRPRLPSRPPRPRPQCRLSLAKRSRRPMRPPQVDRPASHPMCQHEHRPSDRPPPQHPARPPARPPTRLPTQQPIRRPPARSRRCCGAAPSWRAPSSLTLVATTCAPTPSNCSSAPARTSGSCAMPRAVAARGPSPQHRPSPRPRHRRHGAFSSKTLRS